MTNPAFRTVTTQFGTRVLIIEQSAEIEELPQEFTRLIGEEYWQALAAPRECFAQLAERARVASLKRLLEKMAERDFCRVYAAIADHGAHQQTDVYMQGGWPPRGFAFRLAKGRVHEPHPEWLPEPLAKVYEILDGTLEEGPDAFHGLSPLALVPFNFQMEPSVDIPISDPNFALTFYNNGAGDYLVADGDQAYWYRHECNDFVHAGELETIIERYFTHHLDLQTNWVPEPFPR